MLRTGIPAQWVQKQLDDLCVVTPPSKRDLMEDFVTTHRATCARVGVKLAPETDKEKLSLVKHQEQYLVFNTIL